MLKYDTTGLSGWSTVDNLPIELQSRHLFYFVLNSARVQQSSDDLIGTAVKCACTFRIFLVYPAPIDKGQVFVGSSAIYFYTLVRIIFGRKVA
jgi:hypothetical protein